MESQTGARWLAVNSDKHAEMIDRSIERNDKREIMLSVYGGRVRINNRCIKRVKKVRNELINIDTSCAGLKYLMV